MDDIIVLAQRADLVAIADATRRKTGITEEMDLEEIATAIDGIEVGGANFPIGDGNTHIWISLIEGRTSVKFSVGVKGSVTVDWGDGTTPDVITGYSTTSPKSISHTYAKAGEYVITLIVDGTIGITAVNALSYLLTCDGGSSTDPRNSVYRLAIKKIEMGNAVSYFSDSGLVGCYSLESLIISDGISSIPYKFCGDCYSITRVFFPASITSIGRLAFTNCGAVCFYDLSKCTSIPSLAEIEVFQKNSPDFEIRVPAALVDEWKAATNWATYADKIVGV